LNIKLGKGEPMQCTGERGICACHTPLAINTTETVEARAVFGKM
jgi:hypothetical protein